MASIPYLVRRVCSRLSVLVMDQISVDEAEKNPPLWTGGQRIGSGDLLRRDLLLYFRVENAVEIASCADPDVVMNVLSNSKNYTDRTPVRFSDGAKHFSVIHPQSIVNTNP